MTLAADEAFVFANWSKSGVSLDRTCLITDTYSVAVNPRRFGASAPARGADKNRNAHVKSNFRT